MTESETARRSNELSCLVALRDAGELTITELMVATGLSRPTADGIARVLEEGGAIGSAIRPAQGAGRPARVYRFTADELTAGLEIGDRKSTRLNSSHVASSYAVFCLDKKTH